MRFKVDSLIEGILEGLETSASLRGCQNPNAKPPALNSCTLNSIPRDLWCRGLGLMNVEGISRIPKVVASEGLRKTIQGLPQPG